MGGTKVPRKDKFAMAIAKFQEAIWAAALVVRFAQSEVLAQTCNRDYEGELTKGNTVHITSVQTPQVIDYKGAGRVITAADLSDTQIDLVIDQEKAFAFNVDDVDRVQAAGSFEPVTVDAAAALVEDAETFLGTKLMGGNNVDTRVLTTDGSTTNGSKVLTSPSAAFTLSDVGKTVTGTGVGASAKIASVQSVTQATTDTNSTATATGTIAFTIGTAGVAATTGDTAFDVINRIRTGLSRNKVPQGNRFLAVNPDFSSLLLGANSKLTSALVSGDAQGLREATLGKLLGFTVVESALLGTSGVPSAVGYHQSALGYVNQIDKVEALRNQTKFADIIRALHVFGAQVVRPAAMVTYHS